ncbi:MAG: hypothetical protein KTR19_04710 [Hyphomicrobiales bacterium]|nr:hypothetical protein [Hyphomicrobiales bacterium]
MRKKWMSVNLAGLSAIAAVGHVSASTIEHNLTLTASIPILCSLSGAPAIVSGSFSDVTQGSSTFRVSVTGTTANSTSGELTIGDISCTGNQIKVTLDPDGWITNGSSEIAYSAYVVDNGLKIEKSNEYVAPAGGTGEKTTIINRSTTTLGVSITTQESTDLPAGSYSGSLKISIDPV